MFPFTKNYKINNDLAFDHKLNLLHVPIVGTSDEASCMIVHGQLSAYKH